MFAQNVVFKSFQDINKVWRAFRGLGSFNKAISLLMYLSSLKTTSSLSPYKEFRAVSDITQFTGQTALKLVSELVNDKDNIMIYHSGVQKEIRKLKKLYEWMCYEITYPWDFLYSQSRTVNTASDFVRLYSICLGIEMARETVSTLASADIQTEMKYLKAAYFVEHNQSKYGIAYEDTIRLSSFATREKRKLAAEAFDEANDPRNDIFFNETSVEQYTTELHYKSTELGQADDEQARNVWIDNPLALTR